MECTFISALLSAPSPFFFKPRINLWLGINFPSIQRINSAGENLNRIGMNKENMTSIDWYSFNLGLAKTFIFFQSWRKKPAHLRSYLLVHVSHYLNCLTELVNIVDCWNVKWRHCWPVNISARDEKIF